MSKVKYKGKLEILENSIITPDGTRITSKHINHQVRHIDKNGLTYSVSGGNSELYRVEHKTSLKFFQKLLIKFKEFFTNYRYIDPLAYKEDSLFSLDPIEKLRNRLKRGGRGIDGKQPLTFVLLKDVNDDWLKSIIKYEYNFRPENPLLPIYIKEQVYREKNNIVVK